MKNIITNSFAETQQLGVSFAKTLKHGEVIALHGDLGSGKTTFMQGIAKGLGIKKNIISPTFIIMRTYEIGSGHLYHVDLYRVEKERDVDGLGLGELLHDPESVVAIE